MVSIKQISTDYITLSCFLMFSGCHILEWLIEASAPKLLHTKMNCRCINAALNSEMGFKCLASVQCDTVQIAQIACLESRRHRGSGIPS